MSLVLFVTSFSKVLVRPRQLRDIIWKWDCKIDVCEGKGSIHCLPVNFVSTILTMTLLATNNIVAL